MVQLTIRKIGNSLGVILPQEAIARLRVSEGDRLTLTEGPDGMRITPYDPEFVRQMQIAEGILSRYRNAFRELAK